MGDALLTEPDRVDELAGIDLPMLVCHGEYDDAWEPAVQAEMASRMGARYEVICDATHSPAVENTADTSAVLIRFWHSVERR